jgi:hypothetical protein
MKIAQGPRQVGFVLLFTLLTSSAVLQGQELPGAGGGASPEAQPLGRPSLPHLVLVDVRDVLGAPLRWQRPQWERFSLAVAGVGAAALLDSRVRDAEARDHSRLADRVANGFEPLGSGGAWVILGSFYPAGTVGTIPGPDR